jgi:UDP-N-acetylmuramate--alanine ligase
MSGIAEILLNLGYRISGSDLRSSPITQRLASLGAAFFEGHAAGHVGDADAVVVSSAVPAENPELVEAQRRRIPVIQRGELLAELMRLKFGIAIAGSHGKTTTTSMTAAVLNHAHKDPTVVVGGRVNAMGSNARLGKSELLLVESDESDSSLLKLAPVIAVITSIDREHLDHYQSFDRLKETFLEFANKVPFYGSVILCFDDPNVRELLPRIRRRCLTYGMAPEADLVISEVDCGHFRSCFRLRLHGKDLGEFEVRGAGRHNVLNASAAVLVGLQLEIPADAIREGLSSFSGVDRRFQVRGQAGGVTVIDDYGHHPTEIAATLAAARSCEFRRIHVLFQPHRYTRTHLLAEEFTRCFSDCDRLYVLDIYNAGEAAIPGVDAESLMRRIRSVSPAMVEYVGSMDAGIEKVVAEAQPGDVIITLGAGSIWQAGETILARLADLPASVSLTKN